MSHLPDEGWFQQRSLGQLDGSEEAFRSTARPRVWFPHELPWLRPVYRQGYEGRPAPHTPPSIHAVVPWEGTEQWGAWERETLDDLARTKAGRIVIDTERAFGLADAIFTASRGDVDRLVQPFKPRLGGGPTRLVFLGESEIFSHAELREAGDALHETWPGAVWQAITETGAVNLPLYPSYLAIRERAPKIARETTFGSRGHGFYSQQCKQCRGKGVICSDGGEPKLCPSCDGYWWWRTDSLDAMGEPSATSFPDEIEIAQPEWLSQGLDILTPAEKAAFLAMLDAFSHDESLKAWCERHDESYAAKQRTWHRGRKHLLADPEFRSFLLDARIIGAE